jgi:opacity protein-like surface antigen
MKKLLFAAVAALTTPAHAAGCDEATIRGVARGGSVVVLESRGGYNVERQLCTLLNNCGA